jgi:PST family polysaccharide transporter
VLFLPLAAVLPLVSGDLVLALLGPAWTPAAPILAWFAAAILAHVCAALFAQLMTSQGRGAELRAGSVAYLLLRAAGAFAGSQFGVIGLAAGFSLAGLLAVPLMAWMAGRSGPVKLRHHLVALWPGVLLAAVAVLGALLAAETLALEPGWQRLLGVGGGAVLAWAALCRGLAPAWDALLGRAFRAA